MHTLLCAGRSHAIPVLLVPPGVTLFDAVGDAWIADQKVAIGPFSPPDGLMLTVKPDDNRSQPGGPLRLTFDGGPDSVIFIERGPVLIIPARRCTGVYHAGLFGFSAWIDELRSYVSSADTGQIPCG